MKSSQVAALPSSGFFYVNNKLGINGIGSELANEKVEILSEILGAWQTKTREGCPESIHPCDMSNRGMGGRVFSGQPFASMIIFQILHQKDEPALSDLTHLSN